MVKKTNKYILIGAILVVIIVGIVVAFFINNNNKNKKTEVEAVSSEALLLVAASDKVEVQAVASLDELITGADKPILIDFWAEWCAPCKRAEPFVEDLAAQYKDQIHVVKVNIDEQKSLAQAFRVQSIPTFVVIYEGTIVEKKEGFLEDEIIKMIEAQLA